MRIIDEIIDEKAINRFLMKRVLNFIFYILGQPKNV
jgi:hypothetical protein